jgi:hypothetical protein
MTTHAHPTPLGAHALPAPLRSPRTALVAGLVATAVVVGGAPGALLALAAAIVVLRAATASGDGLAGDGEDRFNHLVRSRRRADRVRRLRRLPLESLDVLVQGPSFAPQQRALGVHEIALDSITGTVEHGRARTFDRHFRPTSDARARWSRLWQAQTRGIPVPPISVYRVGERHFIRDGHHRVSVARELGRQLIDAEIVVLANVAVARQDG